MEEVHKQMGEIAGKQNDKISELNAEIRKLKAMIVKHESRIRYDDTKFVKKIEKNYFQF